MRVCGYCCVVCLDVLWVGLFFFGEYGCWKDCCLWMFLVGSFVVGEYCDLVAIVVGNIVVETTLFCLGQT